MKACIVGGGAAGCLCAVLCARNGAEVVLLEKNEKTGKKLQEAQNTIEEAGKRTRTISNKLRTVADIGEDDAERLLSDGSGE